MTSLVHAANAGSDSPLVDPISLDPASDRQLLRAVAVLVDRLDSSRLHIDGVDDLPALFRRLAQSDGPLQELLTAALRDVDALPAEDSVRGLVALARLPLDRRPNPELLARRWADVGTGTGDEESAILRWLGTDQLGMPSPTATAPSGFTGFARADRSLALEAVALPRWGPANREPRSCACRRAVRSRLRPPRRFRSVSASSASRPMPLAPWRSNGSFRVEKTA